jgi:hypothetical protein
VPCFTANALDNSNRKPNGGIAMSVSEEELKMIKDAQEKEAPGWWIPFCLTS